MISNPLAESDLEIVDAQRDLVCNDFFATEVKPKQDDSTKLFAHHGVFYSGDASRIG